MTQRASRLLFILSALSTPPIAQRTSKEMKPVAAAALGLSADATEILTEGRSTFPRLGKAASTYKVLIGTTAEVRGLAFGPSFESVDLDALSAAEKALAAADPFRRVHRDLRAALESAIPGDLFQAGVWLALDPMEPDFRSGLAPEGASKEEHDARKAELIERLAKANATTCGPFLSWLAGRRLAQGPDQRLRLHEPARVVRDRLESGIRPALHETERVQDLRIAGRSPHARQQLLLDRPAGPDQPRPHLRRRPGRGYHDRRLPHGRPPVAARLRPRLPAFPVTGGAPYFNGFVGTINPSGTNYGVYSVISSNPAAEGLKLDYALFTIQAGYADTIKEISEVHEFTFSPQASPASLDLGDDGFQLVTLPFTFNFFGNPQTAAYINPNGNNTFGTGNSSWTETASEMLSGPPRIAAFWDDLQSTANGGVVRYRLVDTVDRRLVVEYLNVTEYLATNANTARITISEDGKIRIEYRNVALQDAIAGISPGGNLSTAGETDLSKSGLVAVGGTQARSVNFAGGQDGSALAEVRCFPSTPP